ncbi:unnamed protein product [Sphenostylis stenocarpa]|uniref:Uncharacterized protein n=1 Tax=Sphenostylis stenocarpa TaxID=92480 RepID=A0AA86RKU7_9FABA|nr:unnamed protein product [Sphenostylis stenocarpa]
MQKEQQDKEYLDSMTCPSFNYYSTVQLAVIDNQDGQGHNRTQNDDTNFEFAAFRDEACFDDAFFPIFNRNVPREYRSSVAGGSDSAAAVLRFPITGDDLRRSEHDLLPSTTSESSSEADELEGIPAGTYCVWTPNSPSKCKKSNSTGSSSKKWKLLDLLRRSNSEGKESFLFLTASPEKKKMNERWSIDVAGKPKGNGLGEKKKVAVAVSAHEALYVKNRELRRIDKKKSFLPYRPELVGFCASRFDKTSPSF